MPLIRVQPVAASADGISTAQNNVIPEGGAILNMWASGVTVGDSLGLLVGSRSIIPNGTNVNIEISADVIDTDRDQLLKDEVVEAGKLSLPIAAITTQMQVQIQWRPLGAR